MSVVDCIIGSFESLIASLESEVWREGEGAGRGEAGGGGVWVVGVGVVWWKGGWGI